MIVQQLQGFDYPPFLIPQANGTEFVLWEEVVYTARQGDSWVIPAGFRTDFATIPAIVSWAVPKLGAYTLAAIVHDALCEGLNAWHRAIQGVHPDAIRHAVETAGRLRVNDEWVDVPTASAVDTDAIFYRIARDHGTDPVTARLLWVGVRLGALANPARREGWLRTAPAVLGWSLVFLPVLLPASILVGVGSLVLKAARGIARLFNR